MWGSLVFMVLMVLCFEYTDKDTLFYRCYYSNEFFYKINVSFNIQTLATKLGVNGLELGVVNLLSLKPFGLPEKYTWFKRFYKLVNIMTLCNLSLPFLDC